MQNEQKAGIGRYRLSIRNQRGQTTVYRTNNRTKTKQAAAGKSASVRLRSSDSGPRLSPSMLSR